MDLYDDTHAMLSAGVIGSLKMKNLLAHIQKTTYPAFEGTPRDNIYVAGKRADKFQPAKKGNNTFGSDHLPISTVCKHEAP